MMPSSHYSDTPQPGSGGGSPYRDDPATSITGAERDEEGNNGVDDEDDENHIKGKDGNKTAVVYPFDVDGTGPQRTWQRSMWWWVLLALFIVLVVIVIDDVRQRNGGGRTNSSTPSSGSGGQGSGSSTTPSDGGSGSAATRCFESTEELRNAVDEYLSMSDRDKTKPMNSPLAIKYGWPLGRWCVSNIEDFTGLFDSSRNGMAATFNDDITNWDMSAATKTTSMFSGARMFNPIPKIKGSSAGGLSTWDMSKNTDMRAMFSDAEAFNGDLSNWNTGKVIDMRYVFKGASAFNPRDLKWNTSSATDMRMMFAEAKSFNGDISSWNTAFVTDMNTMFLEASAFNRDISKWDTSSVSDFSGMFKNAKSFNKALCSWGTKIKSNARVKEMFDQTSCPKLDDPSLTSQPAGPFCHAC